MSSAPVACSSSRRYRRETAGKTSATTAPKKSPRGCSAPCRPRTGSRTARPRASASAPGSPRAALPHSRAAAQWVWTSSARPSRSAQTLTCARSHASPMTWCTKAGRACRSGRRTAAPISASNGAARRLISATSCPRPCQRSVRANSASGAAWTLSQSAGGNGPSPRRASSGDPAGKAAGPAPSPVPPPRAADSAPSPAPPRPRRPRSSPSPRSLPCRPRAARRSTASRSPASLARTIRLRRAGGPPGTARAGVPGGPESATPPPLLPATPAPRARGGSPPLRGPRAGHPPPRPGPCPAQRTGRRGGLVKEEGG